MLSVSAIKSESEKLITLADTIDKVKVHMAKSALKVALTEMVLEFEKNDTNEGTLLSLKDYCQECAIFLESMCYSKDTEIKNRYEGRMLVNSYYTTIYNMIKLNSNSDDVAAMQGLLCHLNFLSKLRERACEINFSLTEMDNSYLEIVEMAINSGGCENDSNK